MTVGHVAAVDEDGGFSEVASAIDGSEAWTSCETGRIDEALQTATMESCWRLLLRLIEKR